MLEVLPDSFKRMTVEQTQAILDEQAYQMIEKRQALEAEREEDRQSPGREISRTVFLSGFRLFRCEDHGFMVHTVKSTVHTFGNASKSLTTLTE